LGDHRRRHGARPLGDGRCGRRLGHHYARGVGPDRAHHPRQPDDQDAGPGICAAHRHGAGGRRHGIPRAQGLSVLCHGLLCARRTAQCGRGTAEVAPRSCALLSPGRGRVAPSLNAVLRNSPSSAGQRDFFRMTYVVNESCIKCKYMDCVEVCPVDCFYEGENMLVILPDECIDCGVCEPECPIDAIKPDTEAGLEKWLGINAEYARVWPNITVKREPPPDAKEWEDKPDKINLLSLNPGTGD